MGTRIRVDVHAERDSDQVNVFRHHYCATFVVGAVPIITDYPRSAFVSAVTGTTECPPGAPDPHDVGRGLAEQRIPVPPDPQHNLELGDDPEHG